MPAINRREWLSATAALGAAALVPGTASASGFTLPKLPYAYDALEPHIDARTMEIHYTKHHQAYVDNLNKALAGTDWLNKPIEDVIRGIESMPVEIQQKVTNNGGGHYNHSMFWQTLSKNGGKPSDALLKAWGGSLEVLRKAIREAALARFGSGWAWLVYDKAGDPKLSVISTANQDCPLQMGKFPLLGVDVWEHAYYLKYQYKRGDYLDNWWQVVNWDAVNARLTVATKS